MKIAAVSDIHSNYPALMAVLEEIEKDDVDLTVCAGDLVGYGPYPNEVIEEIKKRAISTVQGNYDEGVGFNKDDCGCAYKTPEEVEAGEKSLIWTKSQVTDENKFYLRSLPNQILWERDRKKVLLVHGSPRRLNEYLYEARPENTLIRMLKPLDIDVMIFGHTHLPYHRVVNGIHLVNAGSVGRPKDGHPRASYAVVDTGEPFRVEFRRVKYPVELVANMMEEKGLPKWLAEYLRYAGKGPENRE
jgi:putative phosphoesterase